MTRKTDWTKVRKHLYAAWFSMKSNTDEKFQERLFELLTQAETKEREAVQS